MLAMPRSRSRRLLPVIATMRRPISAAASFISRHEVKLPEDSQALSGWEPFTMGTVALGGRDGRVFGHPSQIISYWDLTTAESGCSSG